MAIRRNVARNVASDGYATLPGADLKIVVSDAKLSDLRQFWDDLPMDQDLPDSARSRYRRYGRLRAESTPHGITFESLPHANFRQDSIPLWRGSERRFEPISEEALGHPGMRALVGFDVEVATELSGRHSWEVGLHLIRLVARTGEHGLPTPEGRHRDGHLFVGMHLIDRHNCEGGRSTVYPEQGEPVRTTLLDPPASMFVDDRRVTHEVSPIHAVGIEGHRDMLLVDLNPYGADG
jgi:hypothetical protein